MKSYNHTFTTHRLWKILGASCLFSFALLLWYGRSIYQVAPPLPDEVVSQSGDTLFSIDDIRHGQNVWQSLGGMQKGSIWGHGSYLAPDWSADWLHHEATTMLDQAASDTYNLPFDSLSEAEQEALKSYLRVSIRSNTWNEATGTITVTQQRADAIAAVSAYYANIFQYSNTEDSNHLREQYGFSRTTTVSDSDMHALNAFFFWTAWSAVTERPGDTITYTSNWPYDPVVGNTQPASLLIWSLLSVIVLIGAVGALVWFYAQQYDLWRDDLIPEGGVAAENLLAQKVQTPSMRATAKFFWTAIALFFLQICLGVITAHYTVEGQDLYGIPISDFLPYAVTRTWHTQLAVFWIATAWLATGLYVAPLLGGKEPKFQRLGVNFLYVCLLVIVVGSFIGEWLGVMQKMSNQTANFWFGHQGYEYVDLGRFWQLFLFIGLLLWLGLMFRALLPALKQGTNKSLLILLAIAAIAIGLLYGAGLAWGQHTHISIMEYWRWWVVHLWVEGVFEVFATTIISLLFVNMGLLRGSTATISVLFATIIFLAGGVLGTFHHLYFSGTPIGVIALGGIFSALEVVPLAVIGFEAYQHSKMEKQATWTHFYHWPLKFFLAVSFWNLVGAGLLGFLINTPVALYYMQGLNTTAAHGHGAMFGVYGMLGIGLMLFCLRGLVSPDHVWNERLMNRAFWCLNIGLGMMILFALLPAGLWQTYHAGIHGYWYVRSAEFIHSPVMETLVWARVPGDIVFGIGAAILYWVLFKSFLDILRNRGTSGS